MAAPFTLLRLIYSTENVNFLIADGIKFAHPLHHLGKSKEDLPLIAIDSFRHMYLFPKYDDMHITVKLKQLKLIILLIEVHITIEFLSCERAI